MISAGEYNVNLQVLIAGKDVLAVPQENGKVIYHKVEEGETAWSIAGQNPDIYVAMREHPDNQKLRARQIPRTSTNFLLGSKNICPKCNFDIEDIGSMPRSKESDDHAIPDYSIDALICGNSKSSSCATALRRTVKDGDIKSEQ